MKTIIQSEIAEALRGVGLQSGDSVMVHTSLGKIGYVCGVPHRNTRRVRLQYGYVETDGG